MEILMTQSTKKAPAAAQPSAKLASGAASNKAARAGFAAVESTRSSAENVVKIGTNAVKEMLSSGAGEAQKAQQAQYAIYQEEADRAQYERLKAKFEGN
jgi:hypothetical protein